MLSGKRKIILISALCVILVALVLILTLCSKKEDVHKDNDVVAGEETDSDDIIEGNDLGKDSIVVEQYEPKDENEQEGEASASSPNKTPNQTTPNKDNSGNGNNTTNGGNEDNNGNNTNNGNGGTNGDKDDNQEDDNQEDDKDAPETNLKPSEDTDDGYGEIKKAE